MGARQLIDTLRPRRVWLPNVGWVNHHEIWQTIDSNVKICTYPYYDPSTQSLAFDSMIETLRSAASDGDVIVLQACAHNPTGIDLDREQWKVVAELFRVTEAFPFFDMAYQGFATGDLESDAWPIRYFAKQGLELVVAQSFSKNFGLYGERVGALHVLCRFTEDAFKLLGALIKLSRAEITTCPSYGARIVSTILGDGQLYEQWLDDLKCMSGRMKRMRKALYRGLKARRTPGSWEHILTEIGMFSMTGLKTTQVQLLRQEHHIYLLPSGRIAFTGLTEHNVEYVAAAIDQVVKVNS